MNDANQLIETTAANTGFASGGVTCKLGSLCIYLSSVHVDSFVHRTRPNANPETVGSKCNGRHNTTNRRLNHKRINTYKPF